MARIAVIGGSIGGLATALLLARSGHDVVVFDKDDVAAGSPEDVARRNHRPGAPHAVQGHAFLARARMVLRDRLPDVLASLYDEGVVDLPLPPPPSLAGGTLPVDPDLVFLMVRRSLAEWALRESAARQGGLVVRASVAVTGLCLDDRPPVPRVVGVRVDDGADEPADLVIDASGRRSAALRWLPDAARARVDLRTENCGMVYFSRHYRVPAGVSALPPLNRGFAAGALLPRFGALLIPSENGHVIVALTPLAADTDMKAVRDPATFDAVVRQIPALAAWIDLLQPTSGVYAMGGLQSTLVRLVDGSGPVVHGLHLVGDACSTTNPTFGRGMSWALAHAAVIADAINRCPDDLDAQARAVDAWVAAEVEPFYEDAVATDRQRVGVMRAAAFGEPAPTAATGDPQRPTFPQLIMASFADSFVWHRLSRYQSLLDTPAALYDDQQVRARVAAAIGQSAPIMPAAPAGPTNADLARIFAAATEKDS